MLKQCTRNWFDENKLAPMFQLGELSRLVGVKFTVANNIVTFGPQTADNEIAKDLENKVLVLGTWEDITPVGVTHSKKWKPKEEKFEDVVVTEHLNVDTKDTKDTKEQKNETV